MAKTNKDPIIGISMCDDNYGKISQGVDYSYIRKEYGEQVRAAGGQPIFLDNNLDPAVAVSLCNGIVINGGEDIDPDLYGEEQLVENRIEPRRRTEWELKLIEACDKVDVPILGVCYGLQLLNLYYGGSLYQDIKAELGSQTDHGSSAGSVMQRIKFAADFLGFQKGDNVETAHRHHQAVKEVAPGFTEVAATEDGIIEAIAGKGHFGIQWHSESDGTASSIYGAFIELCAEQHGQVAPSSNPIPEAA